MNEDTAEPRLDVMVTQRPRRDGLGVQAVLDQFAAAITSGDGRRIANLWAVPAYVIADDIQTTISALDEAAKFFGGAKAQYNEMGVTQTRADVQRLEQIGKRLVRVRVRFPWLDANAREVGGETSTYILRRDNSNAWKIRVAVMHGAEAH